MLKCLLLVLIFVSLSSAWSAPRANESSAVENKIARAKQIQKEMECLDANDAESSRVTALNEEWKAIAKELYANKIGGKNKREYPPSLQNQNDIFKKGLEVLTDDELLHAWLVDATRDLGNFHRFTPNIQDGLKKELAAHFQSQLLPKLEATRKRLEEDLAAKRAEQKKIDDAYKAQNLLRQMFSTPASGVDTVEAKKELDRFNAFYNRVKFMYDDATSASPKYFEPTVQNGNGGYQVGLTARKSLHDLQLRQAAFVNMSRSGFGGNFRMEGPFAPPTPGMSLGWWMVYGDIEPTKLGKVWYESHGLQSADSDLLMIVPSPATLAIKGFALFGRRALIEMGKKYLAKNAEQAFERATGIPFIPFWDRKKMLDWGMEKFADGINERRPVPMPANGPAEKVVCYPNANASAISPELSASIRSHEVTQQFGQYASNVSQNIQQGITHAGQTIVQHSQQASRFIDERATQFLEEALKVKNAEWDRRLTKGATEVEEAKKEVAKHLAVEMPRKEYTRSEMVRLERYAQTYQDLVERGNRIETLKKNPLTDAHGVAVREAQVSEATNHDGWKAGWQSTQTQLAALPPQKPNLDPTVASRVNAVPEANLEAKASALEADRKDVWQKWTQTEQKIDAARSGHDTSALVEETRNWRKMQDDYKRITDEKAAVQARVKAECTCQAEWSNSYINPWGTPTRDRMCVVRRADENSAVAWGSGLTSDMDCFQQCSNGSQYSTINHQVILIHDPRVFQRCKSVQRLPGKP